MMPDYLLKYNWYTGDEDPDTDHTFKAENDEEAIKKAHEYGRPGDMFDLYKLVSPVHIGRKKNVYHSD